MKGDEPEEAEVGIKTWWSGEGAAKAVEVPVKVNKFEGQALALRAKQSKSGGLGIFIVNESGYRIRPGGIVVRITEEGLLEMGRVDADAAAMVGLRIDEFDGTIDLTDSNTEGM